MGNTADWYGLLRELLELIARRLTQVSDHLAFSWVCSSWRSIALEIRSDFPPPLPGLMVPTPCDPDTHTCSFFSLSKTKVQKHNLPVKQNEYCIGSSGGWLVTVVEDFNVYIYNPFCRVRFLLPSMRTFSKLAKMVGMVNECCFVQAAAMSSSNPENSVVMVSHTGIERLAFARPGDDSWTTIEDRYSHYDDVIFYKGQFYAVSHTEVVVCDIGPSPKVTLVAQHGYGGCSKRYLVESAGELLLVERTVTWSIDWEWEWAVVDDPYKTTSIRVYKLDMSKHEWCQLQSLGGRTLFLGFNTSYSLLASDYRRCRRDCIYFTDDYIYFTDDYIDEDGKYILKGHDRGIFNLVDGSFNHIYTKNLWNFMPPPTWVIPLPW